MDTYELIAILDTVDVPIVVVGRDFTVAHYNRAAASVLGLTASHLGQSPRSIGIFTDLLDLEKWCAQVVADRVPCRREVRQGDIWFLLRIAPCSGDDDRIGGTVLTLTNVTAFRASLEQAIYEREFTKAILHTVSEPLVVLDADLRVKTANRAFYAMFQLAREEAQDVPLSGLRNHAWDAPGLWPLLHETLADNKELPPLEVEHAFPVIGRRTFLLDARPIYREGQSGRLLLLAFRDITEQKRAEEALRAGERRYREMIDALPVAIYTTDSHGRLTHFNPACIEFSGRVPELGSDHWCVTGRLYHPDGTLMPHDECPMAIALKEGRIVRGVDAIAERPDGTRIWFTPYPTPFRDTEGKIVGGINMLVDITERKQAEGALRDADQRKDEFLAMLSHELRNPLAPVRNALHILRIRGVDEATVSQACQMMERQVEHLVRLVDDLLDMSRIMRGKIVLRKELVQVAAVVARAVETAQPVIDAQGHELNISLPPEFLVVQGDPIRLSQAVGNLLTNAAKYTEKAGRIRLTAERERQDVVIRVQDNGVGISAEMLPKVFDLFVQVERSLDRSQGGLGIGLTLVKRLVEMHGGSVTAFSKGAGQGSAFTIRLPLAQQVEQPGPRASREDGPGSQQLPATPRRRVLVVDDNVDAAESLAMMLRMWHHEVLTVHDGPEALAVTASYQPEIVILDIGLPGLSGYEVARRLRERPGFAEVVLVAMTGYGQDEDRRRSQEAGFDYHLTKPANPNDLQELIASLSGGRKNRQR